jgi:hypothetical protein
LEHSSTPFKKDFFTVVAVVELVVGASLRIAEAKFNLGDVRISMSAENEILLGVLVLIPKG